MEKFEEEFNKIISDNFDDPTKDYYARQYVIYLKTGRCLLSNLQIEILSDDDTRFGDLSSAYGISHDEAKRVYEYIEDYDYPGNSEDIK